jgi:hypothetical protein
MLNKTGRNDLCPCGSGQKFKKCCLSKQHSPVSSLVWQKMRRVEGELMPILLEHATKYYGREAIEEAWDEFSLWVDLPMDSDSPDFEMTFIPWLLYNWVPDNIEKEPIDHLPETTIAQHYVQNKSARVDTFQRRFIEAACSSPFSFYLVKDCIPGQNITLQDLLLNHEVTVLERTASKSLAPGTLIFCRIVTLDSDSIILGLGTTPIPGHFLDMIIEQRQLMAENNLPQSALTPGQVPTLPIELLHEYDIELRQLYFDVSVEVLNPQMPSMQNTDGDELALTKLFYTLNCTPREALEALASLAMEPLEDLLKHSFFNSEGTLISINFSWLKKGNSRNSGWNNTVMGEIHINQHSLTIDVNSKERADVIKRKISYRLGKRAAFSHEVIESLEKMISENQGVQSPDSDLATQQHNELMALPEVQEHLKKITQQHWKYWLDTALPALKGQTPRQASKTPVGRERLEALLLDFEERSGTDPILNPDINELRRQLKMFKF